MSKHDQLLSKNMDTPHKFQKSLENLEKLIGHVFATTEMVERIKFYGWVLSEKTHVAHQQHLAISRIAGVTVPTAYNWWHGLNDCSAAGQLYAVCRSHYATERDMARAFGEFINRDLLKELGL